MNHRKALGRVARLSLALSLLAAGSAMAEPDRVIRGPVTTKPEVRNGVPGNLVTYTDYTYRKFSDHVAQFYPNHGLPEAELNAILALLNASGVSLTDAAIRAAIDAFKNWKNSLPAAGRDFTSSSNLSNSRNAYTNNLVTALTNAIGKPANYSATSNLAATVMNSKGWWYSDPLVFDLNGDGKINVTGLTAAKVRAEKNKQFVAAGSVLFDIQGKGKPDRIEWVTGGDGILVDNRKNQAKQRLAQGKPLSIHHLFGDTNGNTGGFMKLAREFHAKAKVAAGGSNVAKDLGILKGKDLEDMLMWVDNGDGKAEPKELHTLASLGITEIRLPHYFETNEDKELFERASFVRNGKTFTVEEVWFAREAGDDYRTLGGK